MTGLQASLWQNVVMEKVTVQVCPSEAVTITGWKCFHNLSNSSRDCFMGVIKQSGINTVLQVEQYLSAYTRCVAGEWARPSYSGTIISRKSDVKSCIPGVRALRIQVGIQGSALPQ